MRKQIRKNKKANKGIVKEIKKGISDILKGRIEEV